MDKDNFLTKKELEGVVKAVEACEPLWEALMSFSPIGADLNEEFALYLYDSNGDSIGAVEFSDGPVYNPNKTKPEETD